MSTVIDECNSVTFCIKLCVVVQYNMKKVLRETQTLCTRANNFRPVADSLPGGTERPKCNQLEMVTTFGEDRYTQFRAVVVTDPTTHP